MISVFFIIDNFAFDKHHRLKKNIDLIYIIFLYIEAEKNDDMIMETFSTFVR